MQKPHNPFINRLVVPYIQYVTDTKQVMLSSEQYGYEIEAQDYTRMYITKAHREFMFQELSMYARDMFLAIQYFTQNGNEYVILTYEKMQILYGSKLSRRRYEDTVRELIKHTVIDYKDKRKGEYWYDPRFFCAGNRLSMFEQCKVKVATKHGEARRLKT